MLEQEASVVAVAPGMVWVESRRQSACGACASSAGCGTSVVAKLFRERSTRLEVLDPFGLQVGERVLIGIDAETLTWASVLAYLLPLLVLMAAAFLAQFAGAGDDAVALAAILGLGLGLWLTGRLSRGAWGRAHYRPVLLRRMDTPTLTVPAPQVPRVGR